MNDTKLIHIDGVAYNFADFSEDQQTAIIELTDNNQLQRHYQVLLNNLKFVSSAQLQSLKTSIEKSDIAPVSTDGAEAS